MGAALGHTQSLHNNLLDEGYRTPTRTSRLTYTTRNTDIYIQEEYTW